MKIIEIKKNNISSHDLEGILQKKDIIIIKSFFDKPYLNEICDYLFNIKESSLPNYHPIEKNAPNFFRFNFDDARSYVKTFSIQFNFFPWNQDPFNFFEKFKVLFDLRGYTCPASKTTDDMVERLSFQFYPSGKGHMAKHSDPVGNHQLGVVSVVLSKFGSDYLSGGLVLEDDNGKIIYPEKNADIGDIIIFNGSQPHGVDHIDKNYPYNFKSKKGRWMLMSAVTKPLSNKLIANSIPYE